MGYSRVAVAFFSLFFIMSGGLQAQRSYVLEGAMVINGVFDRAMKNYVVVVEGGKITGVGRKNKVIIPPNTPVIDVTGKYIIPGLIDSHVHEESIDDWPAYLSWGITSVNCMYEDSDTALAREKWSRSDSVRAPFIYGTAPIFSVRGGWWEGEQFADDEAVDRFPGSPEEAVTAVRTLKAKGIQRIKLMYDDMSWCRDPLPVLTKMDPGVMTALLGEARNLRMTSEVHAPMMDDARGAMEAGVNALVHGVIDAPVNSRFIDDLIARDMFYMPTFCLYYFLADVDSFIAGALSDGRFRESLDTATVKKLTGAEYRDRYRARYPNSDFVSSRLPTARMNTGNMASNYAQVVLGTNMWALPGIGAHLEMEYMVGAGLTPMQVLTSATFLGAKFLNILPKTGTIEPGKDADVVVLDADPLTDIRNTRSINMVIRKGVIHTPSQLRESPGP